MLFLIAIAFYGVLIVRRPIDARLKRRHVGPLSMASVGVVLYLAWDWLRPGGVSTTYFLGEFAGVSAVYLMSWSLVLATRLRWLEPIFGGLDRMYFWHKRAALWAIVLIAVHILLTRNGSGAHAQQAAQFAGTGRALGIVSALGLLALVAVSLARVSRILRLPYERWLLLHRLTGLLVFLSLLHGWALDRILEGSTPLKVIYVAIGAVGIAAYAYDELVLRRRAPAADYVVARVDRPAPGVVDVTLAPKGATALPVTGGQFVYLRVGGSRAWREHPFSVAGIGADGSVRLTVRALGRDTRRFYANLDVGLPATLSGPYGMFDHTLGGSRQIWIAGGIGIAPFLGWLTHPDGPPSRVDLFYCAPTADDAPFLAELTAAAERVPDLRVHPVFTRSQGRLTAGDIQDTVGPIAPDTHVFLCGPASMVASLMRGLHRLGLPHHYLHAEHFAFR